MGYKFAIKICFLINCSILLSCEKILYSVIEPEHYKTAYDIILKNETGYDLKIEAYNIGKQYDSILLKNNSQLINAYSALSRDAGTLNSSNIFKNDDVNHGFRDSIIVYFGSSRKLSQICKNPTLENQYCSDIPKYLGLIRNKVNSLCKKEIRAKTNENYLGCFRLVLTPEDYDRAIPIVK